MCQDKKREEKGEEGVKREEQEGEMGEREERKGREGKRQRKRDGKKIRDCSEKSRAFALETEREISV